MGEFVGVFVAVAVGLLVGVFVAVAVGVLVGVFVGVLVGVFVGVAVGVLVGVFVGVLVGPAVGVSAGVAVTVAVAVGSAVAVAVAVADGFAVAVSVGIAVGVMHGSTCCAATWPLSAPAANKLMATISETMKASMGSLCFTVAPFIVTLIGRQRRSIDQRSPKSLTQFEGLQREMYPQPVSAGMVVVVGAGPCGLATARELLALGHSDVSVLEAAAFPGGLAASFVDDAGFTWDRGGHVVFSHYGEFDRLLGDTMGDEVERHDRSSFVHVDGRWVPYPFQNNLRHLGPQRAAEALTDLIDAAHRPAVPHDSSFAVWMERQFGAAICELFMRPYNAKVWATPPELMSSSWMAERVPTVDWRRALANVTLGNDDLAWGPNNRFVFPASGGTGAIYERAAAALGDVVRLGSGVSAIDAAKHELVTSGGETIVYDELVWTGALDVLVSILEHVPQSLTDAAAQLVSNSVTVVGIGYETPLTDERSWLYFPDDDVPFYRATNFAKYAPANVPSGRTEQYCSWMTEIASSPHRPLERDGLTERVDAAIRRLGLVPHDAPIASVHVDHIERAYPVPTLGRDAALAVIHPWLEQHDIYSRGRFGAWRYELGNMDHAVKMGVDLARRLVHGTPEEAWA